MPWQVGGMGDVVTALGRAVQEEGHDVSVILPKYDVLRYGAIRDLTQGRDFWYEGVHTRAWHGIVEGTLHSRNPLLPPLLIAALPETCSPERLYQTVNSKASKD